MTRILGIDVSTRATGLVLLPAGWFHPMNGADWSVVQAHTIDLPKVAQTALEMDRVRRLAQLDTRFRGLLDELDPTDVWIEAYAPGAGQMAHAKITAEMTGAIKLAVAQANLNVNTAHVATIRKALLGKLPRGKGQAKAAVQQMLRDMGAPWWGSSDLCDAFAVANYAMGLHGFTCVGVAA